MDFIIDGNAYLNVAISVSKTLVFQDKSLGNTYHVNDIFNDGEYLLKDKVRLQFRDFCINYLTSIVYPINNKIDKIHMVFDSKSWRKEYINDFFDNQPSDTNTIPVEFEYKGNREKDELINLFFDYFHNEILPALITRVGIHSFKFKGAEGDDLIAFLCENLKNNVLVYTVDGDIRQLTHSHSNNRLIMYPKQRTPSKRIYTAPVFIEDVSESTDLDDFFSLEEVKMVGSELDMVIEALVNKDHVKMIVDVTEELFTKIFRGDAKDNITKMYKMTPVKTSTMIELIKEKYGSSSIDLVSSLDEEFINFIMDNLISIHKIKETETSDIEGIRNHLLLNIRLIRLVTELMPVDLVNTITRDFISRDLTPFNFKQLLNLKNNPSLV